ncbi:MAG: Coenzyme F420 hydrogenase/dehydrogenase, beta subunit C-terminal domain, partial [Promethearchaeota archaeon]
YLFEERKIDGAIVSEHDENLVPIPKIIIDEKDIINSAGTRYSISSQMLPLKDIKNISPDVMKEKGIYNIDAMCLAFVGTPCQLRALRKMHFLNITPAHLIKYGISLFCFENFNHGQLYDILNKEAHISPPQIKKTYIKKNFFIESKAGEKYEVEIKKLDPAVRNPCLECEDFTGKYSDISVGSTGAPQGYSMIIIRTQKGKEIIEAMLKNRYIEEYPISLEELEEWKEKKLKNFKRMISLKSKKKKNKS